MSLNAEEKARAIALGTGAAKPASGFEKHFLWAVDDPARACSAREQQWVEYFDRWYSDLVNCRIDEVVQESADEPMGILDAPVGEIRPVERGRRRRSVRSRAGRASPGRTGEFGKQRVALKRRVSRATSRSRRAK